MVCKQISLYLSFPGLFLQYYGNEKLENIKIIACKAELSIFVSISNYKMVKVPYGFYKKNILSIYMLFGLLLLVNGTIGYFVKSYYGFPEIPSIEVVFFGSVLLHFALVQIIFRKKIKEYNNSKGEKAKQ